VRIHKPVHKAIHKPNFVAIIILNMSCGWKTKL